MNKIKNIMIDLDGTLISFNEKYIRFHFMYSLLKWSIFKYNPIRFLKHIMNARKYLKEYHLDEISNYNRVISHFSKVMKINEKLSKEILTESSAFCFNKIRKHFILKKEAINFIEWAAKNYKIYLATNPLWPPEILNIRLSCTGLDLSYFNFISTSKNMCFTKNNPKYFSEYLKLNSLDPNETIMIGNNLNEDGLATINNIPVFIINKKSKSKKFKKNKYSKFIKMEKIFFSNFQMIENKLKENNLC